MRCKSDKIINKLLLDKFFFYGIHLGGLKSFWNPMIKPYLIGFRNNFCIFNLCLTQRSIKQGFRYLLKTILSSKKILFIGSPKGLEKDFSQLCKKYGHYYIDIYTDGFFSNFQSNKAMNKCFSETPPSLIFFFDASVKQKARKELFNLNVPIMAFVNSENDVIGIDYPIPANINSLKGSVFIYNLFYRLFLFQEKIN